MYIYIYISINFFYLTQIISIGAAPQLNLESSSNSPELMKDDSTDSPWNPKAFQINPLKTKECPPKKGTYFSREYIWTNHWFSGDSR